jgi:tRNA-splicing ligase RtcB
MSKEGYVVLDPNGDHKPIKAWTRGVEVEDAAKQQLINLAGMPFIHKHLAVMPDTHWGMGATVGSVVATKGAIIPAAVGVDIGCGMIARRLNLTASELPDNLHTLRTSIELRVPHGRTDNGGPDDKGAWRDKDIPDHFMKRLNLLGPGLKEIVENYPEIEYAARKCYRQAGTLGTGNHFIEVCLDEEQRVWIMLHSGSRGIGNRIGSTFIAQAKKDMERYFISLPDKDLAYITEGSNVFEDYCNAVEWAQDFAALNRELMMTQVIDAFKSNFAKEIVADLEGVNCHHNYISRENHFGANVWVTRKGAVRARKGDIGIIPGSMGTRSYIVEGLGNPDSFNSCSHGAGRRMSRAEARRVFTLEDHIKATEGVECRKDSDVLDETPGAYKDIDAVMEAQKDLVKVKHTLRQVLCVKG